MTFEQVTWLAGLVRRYRSAADKLPHGANKRWYQRLARMHEQAIRKEANRIETQNAVNSASTGE